MTTLARTAAKINRASSCPLMTLTRTPVSPSMWSTTAAESSASRRALVPQAAISSASTDSARDRKRRTTSTASADPVSPMRPWRATRSASRRVTRSVTSGSNVPSG